MNKKRSILVIEDYLSLRENIADFLGMSGFDVIVAKDGAEGVQKAMSQLPDMIICDIQMPNLNGYQVFNSLQQIQTTAIIPFIFLTAKTQLEEIRTGLQLGVDDYITKPFAFDELLASINKRIAKYDRIKASVDDKFKILLESPLNATFILVDGKINFGNAKFASLLGFEAKDIINRKFDTFILEEAKKVFYYQIDKCENNITDIIHADLTIVNAKKEQVKIEFFAKALKIKEQTYLIGNIAALASQKTNSDRTTPITDYYNNNSDEIYKLIHNLLDNNINIDVELKRLADEFELVRNERIKKIISANELTARELEILTLICDGLTNSEIAEKLFLSSRTVDNHRAHLLEKTNCRNTAHLVAFAIKNKLIA